VSPTILGFAAFRTGSGILETILSIVFGCLLMGVWIYHVFGLPHR
jgi:hypothetical protein